MQWERPRQMLSQLFAHTALTHEGWQHNVLLDIDAQGVITNITPVSSKPKDTPSAELLLPGMSNVHSHAFQRAMAGMTEIAGGSKDDNFWSWRQVMYRFKERLTPQQVEITARHLYIELLKQGYTSVGEFHYLHHDTSGQYYANAHELTDRIIAAAHSAGIHLTHLPVYYETSNFGGVAANDGQKRFVHTVEAFLKLVEYTKSLQSSALDMNVGIAPHSLRAVSAPSLKDILTALPGLGMQHSPVHIHVSEQTKEVDDCIAWSGKRPIEWLLEHAPVAGNWCLIHSTHANAQELKAIATSKAVVGLCPTTEANLGDGIFPAADYLGHNGRFGIGSDSNVCVSPWEELRQMEYAQRLITRRRTVLCDETTPSVGRKLFSGAANGGAQALGIKAGSIAPGYRADMIALDSNAALLADKKGDALLDTLIFAMQQAPVTDVWVAGRLVVENGVHALEEQSAVAWRSVLKAITL